MWVTDELYENISGIYVRLSCLCLEIDRMRRELHLLHHKEQESGDEREEYWKRFDLEVHGQICDYLATDRELRKKL